MNDVRLHCVHRNRLLCQLLERFLSKDGFLVKALDHHDRNIAEVITAERPDVLLLELGLPRRLATDIIRSVRTHLDVCKVVLLMRSCDQTEHEKQYWLDCVELGVDGYILEESSVDDLLMALHRVIHGEMFCSSPVMRSMMNQMTQFYRESRLRTQYRTAELTHREVEILQWIAEGLSNKLVAKKLSLSLYTVKNHVHRILQKLDAQDRFEAVHRAVERKLLPTAALTSTRCRL